MSKLKVSAIHDPDNDNEALTIDTSGNVGVSQDASFDGNVGIGTTSPDTVLHIKADQPIIKLEDNQAGGGYHQLSNSNSDGTLVIYADADGTNSSTANMRFSVGGSEKMRINSNGDLLIGQTAGNVYNQTSVQGLKLDGNAGNLQIARDGNVPLLLNRYTTDGEIMQFRYGGSFEGAIYIVNKDGGYQVVFGSANTCLMFNDSIDSIHPFNGPSSSNRDNTTDMGSSVNRFDDIYATNGTIQTSDQNEKQQIASLTDAEMNVAKRLSALFKTFKWNSSVEENGDNARTHSGIIAQDMQQAFIDEGLDAGNYAMFISSTWWEKEISVDAVEANEEEGIEAQDAYTYMDSKYEATEGYTERTRLGVRYPELFAFINAYNDQRFSDLETRIETLENA